MLHWLPGMGSAPTIMQVSPTIEPAKADPSETNMAKAARKLTYSAESWGNMKTMTEVVKGNRAQQQGIQLRLYSPKIKDGVKIVKLNQLEIEQQCQKWRQQQQSF